MRGLLTNFSLHGNADDNDYADDERQKSVVAESLSYQQHDDYHHH
jgi:hypothetical protein